MQLKRTAKDAHLRVRKMLLSQPRSARESASGLFVLKFSGTTDVLVTAATGTAATAGTTVSASA